MRMFSCAFAQASCGDRALTAETPKELDTGLIRLKLPLRTATCQFAISNPISQFPPNAS
jgi:hypothetical protein